MLNTIAIKVTILIKCKIQILSNNLLVISYYKTIWNESEKSRKINIKCRLYVCTSNILFRILFALISTRFKLINWLRHLIMSNLNRTTFAHCYAQRTYLLVLSDDKENLPRIDLLFVVDSSRVPHLCFPM